MRDRTVAVVAAVLLVATAAGVGATGATGDSGPATASGDSLPAASPPGESIRDQVETDEVRLRIVVDEDGSARWTVEYLTRLDDDNTTAAFESLQEDVRASPDDYTARFAERIRNTIRSAENATGREMTATDFGVEAEIEQIECSAQNGCGVITYSFRWEGFARVEDGGDRLAVGDSIDGYLLDDRSTMVVSWPEGYERVSADPDPDSTSDQGVSWDGDGTDFLPGQPRVVVDRSGGPTDGTVGTGTTRPAGGDTGGDADGGGGITPATILLVLVVLGVAAVGIFYFTRSDGASPPVPAADEESPDEGAGDETGGTGSSTGDEGDDGEPAIDEELLSNEERVLRLLERNGGRIKQQEVVQELDWTEAKTSQVVSGMRDEGTIDGFRLGRENVLTLPDVDEGPVPGDEEGEDGDDDRSWNGN